LVGAERICCAYFPPPLASIFLQQEFLAKISEERVTDQANAKADITLTQVIMANEPSVFIRRGRLLSFRSKMSRRHGQARARGIRSSLHVLLV